MRSRHCPQTAKSRAKAQRYLSAGFNRLVESRYQFKTFSTLKPINECCTLILQAVNDMLVIRLMTEAINVWGIHRIVLNDFLIRTEFVYETPMPDLIDGKSRNFDCSLFSQNRERAF